MIGLIFSFLVLLTGATGWPFYKKLEHEVITRFSNHQWDVPSKLYAAPLLLYPGIDVSMIGLFDLLARLDYRQANGALKSSGEYVYAPQAGLLQISLRETISTNQTRQPQRVSMTLKEERIERLTDLDDGRELPLVEIEPELITGLYDQEWEERRVMKLYEIPSLLVKTLLAAEDQRFFKHEGIDPLRIIGAGWANFSAGRTTQGGSTLTQQLVKNFFLTQERTIERKMVEACIALILELHYSKMEILESYLNEIYLGQRGAKSIFGMWEAARFYFGKEPVDLTLSEMAVLAGMVKAPNLHAPTRHPEAALQRRNYVLQKMYEHGDIDREEYDAALQEPITPRKLPVDVNGAPHFADFAREELQGNYPNEALATSGLHVFTSLDMHLQRIAQAVVRKGVEELETQHPHLQRSKPEDRLQACLIAIRPQTGEVLAMVGGRDYQTSQFNRVTQAHRQPGSVFKPMVYLAALAREYERHEGRFLPTSRLLDAPFSWSFGDQVWSPGNYSHRYYGNVTLRRALEQSLNSATARLARQIGLKPIRDTARRMGFVSPLPLYPSMVLGASEVTPYEIAVAFSTLANQGIRVKPVPVKKIVNPEGIVLERQSIQAEQVVPSEVAYMITHMMEGVIEHGTAREARRMGFLRPAAGKTGTTNDYGDAWFVGFTPDLLAVVWVGFDQRAPLNLSGGQAALPIWTEFMKHATEEQPVSCFLPPPGIRVTRSTEDGQSASVCPEVRAEAFYQKEEPLFVDASTAGSTVPTGAPASSVVSFPSGPTTTQAALPLTSPSSVSSSPPSPPPQRVGEKKQWWRLF